MKIPRSLRLCACHELGSNQRFLDAMHRLDFNLSDRDFGDPVPKMVLRGGFRFLLTPPSSSPSLRQAPFAFFVWLLRCSVLWNNLDLAFRSDKNSPAQEVNR